MESEVLRGVSLRPAPAVLVAELVLGDDVFAAALENGDVFQDEEYLKVVLGDAKPSYTRLVEATLSYLPEKDRRLVRTLDPTPFLRLAIESFVVSMPMDVSALFPKAKGGTDSDPTVEEIALGVVKTAHRLLASHPDALEMSWTRLRFAEALDHERARHRIADDAVATRVGTNADKKGWKEFMKDVGR